MKLLIEINNSDARKDTPYRDRLVKLPKNDERYAKSHFLEIASKIGFCTSYDDMSLSCDMGSLLHSLKEHLFPCENTYDLLSRFARLSTSYFDEFVVYYIGRGSYSIFEFLLYIGIYEPRKVYVTKAYMLKEEPLYIPTR